MVKPTNSTPKHFTVVPCFNEARRLNGPRLLELAASPEHGVLLVNDGSTDDTAARIEALSAQQPDLVFAIHLPKNVGKAEAVRAGLRWAVSQGAETVGYFDADLATPPSEMLRLFTLLNDGGPQFALASRVALLGNHIERTASRHYLGRIFATAASVAMGLPIYDTQCGAKAMRVSEVLKRALEQPFTSRWVFDIELMMRLLEGNDAGRLRPADFVEMPLRAWEDVKGSKLSLSGMAGAARDLARLGLQHRRR